MLESPHIWLRAAKLCNWAVLVHSLLNVGNSVWKHNSSVLEVFHTRLSRSLKGQRLGRGVQWPPIAYGRQWTKARYAYLPPNPRGVIVIPDQYMRLHLPGTLDYHGTRWDGVDSTAVVARSLKLEAGRIYFTSFTHYHTFAIIYPVLMGLRKPRHPPIPFLTKVNAAAIEDGYKFANNTVRNGDADIPLNFSFDPHRLLSNVIPQVTQQQYENGLAKRYREAALAHQKLDRAELQHQQEVIREHSAKAKVLENVLKIPITKGQPLKGILAAKEAGLVTGYRLTPHGYTISFAPMFKKVANQVYELPSATLTLDGPGSYRMSDAKGDGYPVPLCPGDDTADKIINGRGRNTGLLDSHALIEHLTAFVSRNINTRYCTKVCKKEDAV